MTKLVCTTDSCGLVLYTASPKQHLSLPCPTCGEGVVTTAVDKLISQKYKAHLKRRGRLPYPSELTLMAHEAREEVAREEV